MAILRKINTRAKRENNTGFGSNASAYGGRLVNKNGQPNIQKKGVGIIESISWYHTMLELPGWKFMLILFSFYIVVNFIFAGVYYAIGVEHLGGMDATTPLEKFGEAYFFSAQTFTTVGYGRINPTGFITSTVAALEALIGLLSFAIATGLFYGRFSKPRAFLRFSDKALIAPFKEGVALMMRVAPFKNTTLTDAEAKVTARFITEENGAPKNEFYPLELEYSIVNALTLSWTIVHPINEQSPFYSFTAEDFKNTKGELVIFLKAFDDTFSNTVVSRTSYTFEEIMVGARFIPMFYRKDDNSRTVLDLDKLSAYTEVDVSQALANEKNTGSA